MQLRFIEHAFDIGENAVLLQLADEIGERPLPEVLVRDRRDDRCRLRQIVPRGQLDAVLVQRLGVVSDRLMDDARGRRTTAVRG